jgi:hypothetical protein
MEVENEIRRSWVGQSPVRKQSVYLGLNAHVSSGFELKIATLLILVKFTGKRPFDVAWTGVVAFDQIAVVGVHDAYSIGQIRGCEGMQKFTEHGYGGCQICNDVRNGG